MGNILRNARSAAAAVSRRLSGDPVTYVRGETETPVPFATQGKTRWETRDRSGQSVVTYSSDWLVPVDCLDDPPQRDDEIRVTINGKALVFAVLPFGTENRVFRFHGTDRTTYRIYSKLIAETDAES